MSKTVTVGGDRVGSGDKLKQTLHGYERSNSNLDYVFRTTMSAGTLVPFMKMVALPGGTYDVGLKLRVNTNPTIGPLYGSYKMQLDVYAIPMNLYHKKMMINKLGVGMKMQEVKLPKAVLTAQQPDWSKPMGGQQVNPSSIWAYLGVRGLGYREDMTDGQVIREFNCIPYLMYWDIYKNYYANKQEEVGYVIHHPLVPVTTSLLIATLRYGLEGEEIVSKILDPATGAPTETKALQWADLEAVFLDTDFEEFDPSRLTISWTKGSGVANQIPVTDIWEECKWIPNEFKLECKGIKGLLQNPDTPDLNDRVLIAPINARIGQVNLNQQVINQGDIEPKLTEFPLENIDTLRENLLNENNEFKVEGDAPAPYNLSLLYDTFEGKTSYALTGNQEGLGIKTYQSDYFNNWMATEWIDGENGISAVTAVDTSDGSFTLDELNLNKKIYNMLNRIAISGGTFNDWIEAVYDVTPNGQILSPVYVGGMSREIVFAEVISSATVQGENEPLGTLAGRGVLADGQRGGNMIIKVDQHSYIMGIVSITPRIDYSQGNDFDMSLDSMNDWHKPQLDQIGYQDLTTDKMAWFDTMIDTENGLPVMKSAGKLPAWMDYQTNWNRTFGNFALENDQMYQTLNRRYEIAFGAGGKPEIGDLTTYIDPAKYNYTFAYTRRDAQNFQVQIGVDCTARQKMSERQIPNL